MKFLKSSLLFSALLIGSATVYGQVAGPFKIDGTIKGRSAGFIYLNYTNAEGKATLDSAAINNGRFQFSGTVEEVSSGYLRGNLQARSSDDPNVASLFFQPGNMKLDLTHNDFKNFNLEGSAVQQDLEKLNAAKAGISAELKPFIDAYMVANQEYITARQQKKTDAELDALSKRASDLRDKFEPYNKRKDQVDYAFFRENPDSYITAYMLLFKASYLPLDSMNMFYEAMTPRVKKSSFGKRIADEIVKLKKGAPGAIATNFASTDINGKPFNLADLRGKYVLVDFWASWCVPCREGNPHLKQLYAKYNEKGLEIVGVSDDDSAIDAWKKAVAQDGIGIWKHVLRGLKRTATGFDRSADISENYGIHSLPTKILIDKNGVIIGRYGGGGGSDEDMDKKLAEIMK